MKRLMFALILVLLSTQPVAAGPLFGTLIFGAGAGTVTFLGMATTSLGFRLLASVALSALARALTPKPKQPGIRTQYPTAGGTNPQTFMLGIYASEGNRTAPNYSHGTAGRTPNAYLTMVRDFGDVAGMQLSRVMIDKEYVTLDTTAHPDFGFPVLEFRENGTDYAWVKYYDGSQTAADPFLLATFATDPDYPWSSDMVGTGIPYGIFTFRYNRERFSAEPAIRCELEGIPLYDPRKDTTVGGSGAHRWGNLATYEVTTNPQVIKYNILRGISLPDGNIWGGEAAASDLPQDNWFAAMNACDVVADGETDPQYQAGIEVQVADQPADIIDDLDKACAGQTIETGGVWKTRSGGPGMPVYFFTDDDVIVTEEDELDPFPGLETTYNGVQATYPDPESLWNPKEAPARYNATYEAEDQDRRLVANVQFDAVPFPDQVQRLMKFQVEEERRFLRHSLVLPPDAAILEPLDCVSWTSSRNGYTSKEFEVSRTADDQVSCNQAIAIRERDSADVYWVSGYLLPSAPTGSGRTLLAAQAVPGWAVAASTIRDAVSADRRPCLSLGWTATGLDDVRAVRWQVRVKATGDLVSIGSTHDVEAAQVLITDGVLANVEYEARGRLVVDRPTAWTAWLAATTGNVLLSTDDLDDDSVTLGKLATDAVNAISDAAQSALDDKNAAVAAYNRTLLAAMYRNPGFELDAIDAPGIPTGWKGESEQATAFTTYLAARSNVDVASTYSSEQSYGSTSTDAGKWWKIGKRFLSEPSQEWTVSAAVSVASNQGASHPIATDWIGEDDWLIEFIWLDEDGVELSRTVGQGFQKTYDDLNGSIHSANTWYPFSQGATAPAGTAYVDISLVAVDCQAGVSNTYDYATWAVGNAHCKIDDVVFGSTNGSVLEVDDDGAIATAAAGVATSESAAANDAAVLAIAAKNVTAKLMSQNASPNPVFSIWTGAVDSTPDFWFSAVGTGGTLVRETTAAKYENYVQVETIASPVGNNPRLTFGSDISGVNFSANPDGVTVILELELLAGDWESTQLRCFWNSDGGTNANEYRHVSDYVDGTETGIIRRLEIYVPRPDNYVAGGASPVFEATLYSNSAVGTRQYKKYNIHSFSVYEVVGASQATITQTAVATLEGNAAASIVMRAKAGGGAAAVELVAADDPIGGSATLVKLTGDEIVFDGLSVFEDTLQSSNFVTGVSGWQINNDGTLELQNLIARAAVIDGAVSNGGVVSAVPSPTHFDNAEYVTAFATGEMLNTEAWNFAITCSYRHAGFTSTYNAKSTLWDKTYYWSRVVVEYRRKPAGGSWGSWIVDSTSAWSTSYTTFDEHTATFSRIAANDDFEVRVKVETYWNYGSPFGTSATEVNEDNDNIKDANYIARALVR